MTLPTALLLDLDGTLLDTAPEMAGALEALHREEGVEPLPFNQVRPTVSHGSTGMLNLAFSRVAPTEFERLRARFLDIYRTMLGSNTRLFAGFDAVLDHVYRHSLAWGVVTNKPGWLTDPLLQLLDINPTNGCIVSGDTVGARKPHPLPLLHAAGLIAKAPAHCLYVGDAERDIAAGRAAGMMTVVARWGYLGNTDDPSSWQADGIVAVPADLMSWLHPGPAPGVAS
ncbi:MAG: HAD-IA family hydrolase [Steroidobacteraceae bacterium]